MKIIKECKHYFNGDSYEEDDNGELVETCQFCGAKQDNNSNVN